MSKGKSPAKSMSSSHGFVPHAYCLHDQFEPHSGQFPLSSSQLQIPHVLMLSLWKVRLQLMSLGKKHYLAAIHLFAGVCVYLEFVQGEAP